MTTEFAAAREFVRGAARRKDLVYIISKVKALLAEDVPHCSVVAVYQGNWADAVDAPWSSTAIAVARTPVEKVIVVGEDGDVFAYAAGTAVKEALEPRPVLVRSATTIEGEVYACGMKRQVYRRQGDGAWRDISATAPKPKQQVGFEALDGYSHREIYAVGWQGEIWQYDGTRWLKRTSPTKLILTAVCCAPDGMVYVAGQQGVMIRGREDTWELVAWRDDVGDDLWDLCWYKNKLYVSTMTGLYTLEGNALVNVDVDVGSFYSLSTADDVLWSIGRDEVASFDGTTWRRYD